MFGRRSVVKSAAVALALLVIVGCTGGEEGGQSAPSTSLEGTDGTQAGGEPVDLFVAFNQEGYIPPDNFESFREAYPNIEVSVEVMPGIFPTLIQMREAGERRPDVFLTDGLYRSEFFEAGLIQPLDDLVARWEEEDPELFAQLYPVVWEQGMYDGQVVGMADSADMDQIFYRWDWWQEAGFEEECCESWDQILEASRLIKENHPETYPWAMQALRGEGVNSILSHMSSIGIEFVGSTPQLTSESGLHLISFYQSLSAEGLTHPDTINWAEDDYRGAFAGSRAAFSIDGIHAVPGLEEAGLESDVHWKLANLPLSRSGEQQDGDLLVSIRNWHINSETEHPYEASLVMRYVMEPENALAVVLEQGRPASRHEYVLGHPDFRAHVPLWTDQMIEDFAHNTMALPSAPNVREIESTLELFVQDMLQNPATPPDEIANKWQAELDSLD